MRLPPPSEPNSHLWQTLNNSRLLRYILLFACGWVTVLIINYFYGTIALFTTAGIFAALLNYPVVWLSRHIPRGWAITITFLVALALLLGLVALVGLQVLSQGQGLLTNLREGLKQQDFLPLQEFLNRLNIGDVVGKLQTGLASGLGIVRNIFSSLFIGVFGAVISLYMLIDGGKLWRSFLNLLPIGSRDRFAKTFQQSFLGFIRGQLLLMLFLSSTTLIFFPFLGVNYALLLAIIIGIIDAIPGIGATLGVIVVTFLIFAAQGTEIALRALIVCIILIQIQDNYVRPKVMGDALELNPVLLFLALFIGERVAGLLGIFLAIPIAGMIAVWMRLAQEEQESQLALEETPEAPVEPVEKL
ncbi:AI-2E family transporter (plasmid) [Kovacikia minuta CCNUW1]|uniref:AI-2E family transporter n=1 Tax=Kovacikia minuta TaxID=2931930 RepID=UPI001CCFE314|nr:AI-2E family transporter [Kovacikia minuta]UBF30006.1 AI-2E family transporter [Kovacikia minuta CCNUW1]